MWYTFGNVNVTGDSVLERIGKQKQFCQFKTQLNSTCKSAIHTAFDHLQFQRNMTQLL